MSRFLAVVLLVVVTAASAQEPSLHRGSGWAGAADFLKLGTMTIVYPAGEGEPLDRNRRSAEARARWLTANFRAKVEVAADDKVTESQRNGNILVLGWANRLWDVLDIERPFRRDVEGLSFLGIREPGPDVDLLLYHRSPVQPSSFILFWSRIDPERDRFQVLPRVGSDWALYRDYAVIRQGMFKPATAWPPARDPAAEADHTTSFTAARQKVGTLESKSYRAEFDKTAITEAEVREILAARESALQKAVAAVGSPPEGFRIALHLYQDVEAKRAATGVGDPAHSLPSRRAMFMVRSHARSTSPHEEVHLLAEQLYGQCVSSGLYEGLALAIEGSYRGDPLEWYAARMRSDKRLPSVVDLLDEQVLRGLPEDRGLVGAGLLVQWLRSSQGPEAVRKIYALPEVSSASVAKALGTTETSLDAEFGRWADAQVEARRADLEFDAAEAEAQRRQRTGDWPGMIAALKKAIAARPGDPQTLFNLASAQMRARELTDAESNLKELLGLTLPPEGSRFKIFGHYQLGRVYDLADRRESALSEYRRVLELPDEHGAHDLARQRIASPATYEHLE